MTNVRRRSYLLVSSLACVLIASLPARSSAQTTPAPPPAAAGDDASPAPSPPPPGTPSPSAPMTAQQPGPAQADAPPADVARRKSIVEFDIQPTVRVLKTDEVEVRAGGLVQVQVAPYVGSDATIANQDPATDAGFRLRRAGFGLQGRLLERFGTLLSVNAIQTGTEADRAIGNAILWYEAGPALLLTVGTVKVPFSRAALESSRTFTGIDRPLAVNLLTPSRRLGLTAEGHLADGHVVYLAGVMNGTEGFALGNQFGGVLGGARLEAHPWQAPNPYERIDGAAVAANVVYGSSPAVRLVAYSVDVYGAFRGAHLKVEAMCDQQTPKEAPAISPTLPDTLRRCGAYAETGYVLPVLEQLPIQPMARLEVLDDNRAIGDAGDVAILDTGVNVQVVKNYVRAQLHYIGRYELRGPSRANDAVILALQGTF